MSAQSHHPQQQTERQAPPTATAGTVHAARHGSEGFNIYKRPLSILVLVALALLCGVLAATNPTAPLRAPLPPSRSSPPSGHSARAPASPQPSVGVLRDAKVIVEAESIAGNGSSFRSRGSAESGSSSLVLFGAQYVRRSARAQGNANDAVVADADGVSPAAVGPATPAGTVMAEGALDWELWETPVGPPATTKEKKVPMPPPRGSSSSSSSWLRLVCNADETLGLAPWGIGTAPKPNTSGFEEEGGKRRTKSSGGPPLAPSDEPSAAPAVHLPLTVPFSSSSSSHPAAFLPSSAVLPHGSVTSPFFYRCNSGAGTGSSAQVFTRLCIDYSYLSVETGDARNCTQSSSPASSPTPPPLSAANGEHKYDVPRASYLHYAVGEDTEADRIVGRLIYADAELRRRPSAEGAEKEGKKGVVGRRGKKGTPSSPSSSLLFPPSPYDRFKVAIKGEYGSTLKHSLWSDVRIPSNVRASSSPSSETTSSNDDRGHKVGGTKDTGSISIASDSGDNVIHVTYWHSKYFQYNLGHTLYRVLDMVRTARGLVASGLAVRADGSSSFHSSDDGSVVVVDPIVGSDVNTAKGVGGGNSNGNGKARLVALVLPEVSGHDMGPFMVPLLRASALFSDVVVAPSDGQRYDAANKAMGPNARARRERAEAAAIAAAARREQGGASLPTTDIVAPTVASDGAPPTANGTEALCPLLAAKRAGGDDTSGDAPSSTHYRTSMFLHPSPPTTQPPPQPQEGSEGGGAEAGGAESAPQPPPPSPPSIASPSPSSSLLPSVLSMSGLQCFDNCVTNSRGGPQFAARPYDGFMVGVIREYARDLQREWGLHTRCGAVGARSGANRGSKRAIAGKSSPSRLSSPSSPFRRVVIINRRATRRILNVEALRGAIIEAYGQRHGGAGAVGGVSSVRDRDGADEEEEQPSNPFADRLSVEVVELEKHHDSLAQQAAAFYCGDIIVAVHGAAIAWAVAMRTRAVAAGLPAADGGQPSSPSPPPPPAASSGILLEVLPYDWDLIVDDGDPRQVPIYQTLVEAMGVEHIVYPLGRLPAAANGAGSGGNDLSLARESFAFRERVKRTFSANFEIREKGLNAIAEQVVGKLYIK